MKEVFRVWTDTWAPIYKAKKGKDGVEIPADQETIDFLKKCYDTFFLVNVVDNDYIGGDLNKVMM